MEASENSPAPCLLMSGFEVNRWMDKTAWVVSQRANDHMVFRPHLTEGDVRPLFNSDEVAELKVSARVVSDAAQHSTLYRLSASSTAGAVSVA